VARTIEEVPEEGQIIDSEPVPAKATVETAPSTSLQGEEESDNLENLRPSSR